jgi:hypothetical protein
MRLAAFLDVEHQHERRRVLAERSLHAGAVRGHGQRAIVTQPQMRRDGRGVEQTGADTRDDLHSVSAQTFTPARPTSPCLINRPPSSICCRRKSHSHDLERTCAQS